MKKILFFAIALLISTPAFAGWKGMGYKIEVDAVDVVPNTDDFDNNLSSADDTLQKALDTLDDLSTSSVSDTAYAASWDGVTTIAPSKNAVYDAISGLGGGHDAVTLAADAGAVLGLSTQELNLDTQTANYVFAGPASGAVADPAFRALVDADIPNDITITETDPNALLTAGTDNVKDTHIDWGTGAGQVSTTDITEGTNLYSTLTNIQSACTNDFHNIGGTDANTTYTGGDGLTLTGTDFDFDGGDSPGGELGNTWASPTIDDGLAVTSWSLTTPTVIGGGTFNNANTSAGFLSIYEDTDDGTNYTKIQVVAQAGDITYSLPPDDGDAGEQLQTNGSGVLTWEAAGAGSATAWDDIGDPDADATIAFAGYEQTISSTLNEAAHTTLTIHNSTADITAAVTTLKLTFTDDGQTNGTFFDCLDNAGADSKFKIGSDGNTTIAGTLTALSYGGITEANLVDKSASETISGTWEFGRYTTFTYANDTENVAPFIRMNRAKAGPAAVVDGNWLGDIRFYGYGSDVYQLGAYIGAAVDGTPGSDETDMPTEIFFMTAPDDSATPVTRLSISSAGLVNVAGLTASEMVITDASKNLVSAAVATYPSLAEIAHLKGMTSKVIDDDQIDTFAELDAIVADKALVNKADGAVWLGVHDFGGATSVEVPNAANPTTAKAGEMAIDTNATARGAIEIYGATGSALIPAVYTAQMTIYDPDGVQAVEDAIPMLAVEEEWAPHGITILDCGWKADATVEMAITFEEWTAPATYGSDIEAISTVGATALEAEDDGTIADSAIAAGSIVMIDLDTDALNFVQFWITYIINEGN